MITTIAILAVFFLILFIYLINKIQIDKQRFNTKIKVLEDFIVIISDEQKIQSNQLQLSEELKKKLVLIDSVLNKDIYDVNFTMIEELYPRK